MSTPQTISTEKPEADHSHVSPEMPARFLTLKDVLTRLTISRSLLYVLIKDPERPFPAPVHLGRRSVWVEGEVDAYMRDVVAAERD